VSKASWQDVEDYLTFLL